MIFIFLLSRVSNTIGITLLFSAGKSKLNLSFLLFNDIFLAFFSWLVGISILHLFAELWGNEGKVKDLFLTGGFVLVPLIFISPLAIIIRAFSPEGLSLGIIVYLIIFCWLIIMGISALKNIYVCSGKRAFLILVTPFLSLGILFSIGVFTYASFFFAWLF